MREIQIRHLSNQDWAEIKQIAIELHDQGTWNQDQMKCSVSAFIKWLKTQEIAIDLGDDYLFFQ